MGDLSLKHSGKKSVRKEGIEGKDRADKIGSYGILFEKSFFLYNKKTAGSLLKALQEIIASAKATEAEDASDFDGEGKNDSTRIEPKEE